MSVLVKGMKMPSECDYCAMCRYYRETMCAMCNATNRILKQFSENPVWIDVKRPEWCPLVEIPDVSIPSVFDMKEIEK